MSRSASRSIITLPVLTEAVILRWGKYEKTIKEPGLHYSNMFGRSVMIVKVSAWPTYCLARHTAPAVLSMVPPGCPDC